MTNVYWVHMPRNISRPPAEDTVVNCNVVNSEAYLANESLSASASCSSKHLYFML